MRQYQFQYLDKNITIHLHTKSDAVSGQIELHNTFFESAFLEWLRVHYPVQTGIIDIGANIGNHALFFAEFLTHDQIYCFEPEESNLELLKLNMEGKKCQIFEMALSDHEGTATLYNSDAGNMGAFSLEIFDGATSPHPLVQSFEVKKDIPIRTLDSYNLTNISMIKIDVENHERPVLEGSRQTILNNKPIILMEDLCYTFPDFYPADRFNDFFDSIDYVRLEKDIGGFYCDLWAPLDKPIV